MAIKDITAYAHLSAEDVEEIGRRFDAIEAATAKPLVLAMLPTSVISSALSADCTSYLVWQPCSRRRLRICHGHDGASKDPRKSGDRA